VPPVMGVLICARKLPDIFPALYSTVAFAETVIVVKEAHVVPKPGNGVELVEVAIIEGQHSIVTAPPVTGPLPVTLNVTLLGSGKKWVTPSPLVVAT
jgi:hypothetical protein